MKTFDKEYFATRRDLLPNLERLESDVKLQYVLEGMFQHPEPTVFAAAAKLPDLGVVKEGDYMATPSYLVTEAGKRILVKEIPQRAGGVLYEISLFRNITGFAFRPSGRFGRRTLIPGRVGTATGNKSSLALCQQFWRALSQGFVKVGRYHLGPEAYRLLERGVRLTPAVQCPPNRDVRLAAC